MTIFNPNPVSMPSEMERELDDDVEPLSNSPVYKVKERIKQNYDTEVDKVMGLAQTKIIQVDAKILEGNYKGGKHYKTTHFRDLKEFARHPIVRKRIRDHYRMSDIREAGERLVEMYDEERRVIKQTDLKVRLKENQARRAKLREDASFDQNTAFDLGLFPDEITSTSSNTVFPLQDTFLPSINSPYSKQMLWVDYQLMHRQAFEACTKNPIAKRIVRIIPQFVLGRSVVGTIKEKQKQAAWDEFWAMNKMRSRLKQTLRELLIFGEVFYRFFQTPSKTLAVRSIDPVTIWDIVTNPDDLEDVYYYHQQYMVSINSPIAINRPVIPAALVVRQIPSFQVDHYTINKTMSEKRGRSEVYAILGWLLRYKEFMNDRILLNKMRAMFALDVKVTGGPQDVATAAGQFGTPPGPGATLIHNETVDISFKNANTGAQEASTDADSILKIIAVGAGVSENFLGVAKSQTRAGALISTEPDVKNFEDYQELMEDLLSSCSERVFSALGLTVDPAKERMEFTFPSIASEDRSAKLKDIALAEAMDWFSKNRSAEMAAKEFQITEYDRKDELNQIKLERAAPMEPVMAMGFQQLPKVPMFPDEQAMLGELGAGSPGGGGPGGNTNPNAPASPHAGAGMGFPTNTGGRNLPSTPPDLNASEFTRGGEAASISGNKSSGIPGGSSGGSASALGSGGYMESKRGWSKKAREAAILVRRHKRDLREAAKRGAEEALRAQKPQAVERTIERDPITNLVVKVTETPVETKEIRE